MTHVTLGATRLKSYLAENKKSQGIAMTDWLLDVTDTALQTWLSGRGKPSLENAFKIQQLTGIAMTDWLLDG
jgi:hypothetical protein